MRRFRFFRWIIIPALLFAGYLMFGLPHLRWSYSWRDDGQGHDPLASRFYTRCAYIGPYGQFTIHHPANGECAWIVFRKSSDRQG